MLALEPSPEEARNRALRRIDWRFLLPNPGPWRTVCFSADGMASGLELVSEHVLTVPPGTPGQCDLAVAVDPAPATMRAAWEALAPGGSFYTEWHSPLAGGHARVRRRLEDAGFRHVSCYWPWPSPARAAPLYWLPLDGDGAVRHFLATRPRAHARLVRWGHALRQLAWRGCFRLGLLVPVCAVAIKASKDERLPGRRAARSRLLLTGGPRTVSKAVTLVFAEPDSRPRLVVKMPRVPEAIPGLVREAAALRAVQTSRPDGVPGAPRILFKREHGQGVAVGETALSGTPLFRVLRRDNYRDLAFRAADWLARLAGQPRLAPPSAWWDRLVEPTLAEFDHTFGAVVDPRLVCETRAILRTLGPLPVVPEQRDFAPWNVLVGSDGELAVLDWESAEPHGLPLLDLLYFLSYLAFTLDGAFASGAFRASYRRSLDPSTFTGRVRQECLERYAHLLRLDLARLTPQRLLVWLIHSRSDYQHLVADRGGEPDPAALAESLFLSLWREELRAICHH